MNCLLASFTGLWLLKGVFPQGPQIPRGSQPSQEEHP